LIDTNGKITHLKFNGDYSYPLLTTGWKKMINKYNLVAIHELIFYKIRESDFILHIGRTINHTDDIPHFHSRNTEPGKTKYFDKTLSTDELKENHKMVMYKFYVIYINIIKIY
jgi:hypothetical protein